MGHEHDEFAEFYRASRDPCLSGVRGGADRAEPRCRDGGGGTGRYLSPQHVHSAGRAHHAVGDPIRETTDVDVYPDLGWVVVMLSNYTISNQVGSLIQLADQLITQPAAARTDIHATGPGWLLDSRK
jgi:hypothetical protein